MAKSAIVIGAGIAGLAMSRALGARGYSVRLLERNGKASGASVRNFGMIWPVGQPEGPAYEAAMRSRGIWQQVCEDAGVWYEASGSLHLAHREDEWSVLNELQESYGRRGLRLLDPGEVKLASLNATPQDLQGNPLKGGLFSPTEMIVDPREAIAKIPGYLIEKYGANIHWSEPVHAITERAQGLSVSTASANYEADEVYVCSGPDFETLFPAEFRDAPLTRCKLQMMRLSAQPQRMGPALCGALSLGHYASFRAAASLEQLKERFASEYPEHVKWGIHVMVSQNQAGEFTVGDSHEYGMTPDPFDKAHLNQLILGYLGNFARFSSANVTETWNGIYPKLTNGEAYLLLKPAPGVTIVNGFGGAGMTLAFGVCDGLL